MTPKIPHIVATRKLEEKAIGLAMQKGIFLESADVLQIAIKPESDLNPTLRTNIDPWVFTSFHAVVAVESWVKKTNKQANHYPVYAIEGRTSAALEEHGFRVLGTAPDAERLASLIADRGERAVLHCTTFFRRKELEVGLSRRGLEYTACETYVKEAVALKFSPFDGVIFFSPSQVDAFLIKNDLPPATPAFCIGNTTAGHLAARGHQHILISATSQTDAVLTLMFDYFYFQG